MIFIDSGAWVGRYISDDQHHAAALRAWTGVEQRSERCVTSNFVLDETLTLLARRSSYEFAAERGRSLYSSSLLEIVRPDRNDEIAALESFAKLADQGVSFTDCISFALMKRHRVRRAFTFDRHFRAAGFEVWPGR